MAIVKNNNLLTNTWRDGFGYTSGGDIVNKIYYFIILTIVVLIIGTALSVKVKSLRSLFPFALGIFSIAISCYFWDASMWKSFAYTFAIIGVVLTLVGISSSVRKIKKDHIKP